MYNLLSLPYIVIIVIYSNNVSNVAKAIVVARSCCIIKIKGRATVYVRVQHVVQNRNVPPSRDDASILAHTCNQGMLQCQIALTVTQ